jgi:hypothetical protein
LHAPAKGAATVNQGPVSEEEWKERLRLFEKTRDEVIRLKAANSSAYDKAILTLSSVFLGLSITFAKDIGGHQPDWPFLLVASWFLFCGAIVSTLFSFLYSQDAFDLVLMSALRFYVERVESAMGVGEKQAKRTRAMNIASGVLFVLGVLSTLVFATANLSRIATVPTDTKTVSVLTLTKGQPVTALQPVLPTTAPTPAKPAAPVQPSAAASTGAATQGQGSNAAATQSEAAQESR